MINHSDFLEAIKFYGEIGIGQIGFQVIAISLGRRASGEWKAQDSVRFMMMIYNSIQGIILCYLPFYFVSLLSIVVSGFDLLFNRIFNTPHIILQLLFDLHL